MKQLAQVEMRCGVELRELAFGLGLRGANVAQDFFGGRHGSATGTVELPRLLNAKCALAHISPALRAYDSELELVGHRKELQHAKDEEVYHAASGDRVLESIRARNRVRITCFINVMALSENAVCSWR